MTRRTERERRLAIFEAECGRTTDWWVELDGRRIARLTEGRWIEMFWWQYRVDVSDFDDEARSLVANRDLWLRCELSFRSVPFGDLVNHAFCGGKGPDAGLVMMRALQIDIGEPTLWERLVLWLRGRAQ